MASVRSWSGPSVYRNPSRARAGAVGAVVFLALAGLIQRDGDLGGAVVFAAAAAVTAWATWAVRIVVDDDAVHLLGWRHRRVLWGDVAGVEYGRGLMWDTVLVVRTRQGRVCRSSAVCPLRGQDDDYARRTCAELIRYGIRRRAAAGMPDGDEPVAPPRRPRRRAAALRRKRRRRSR